MPDVSFVVEPGDGRATWFDGSLVQDRVIAKCTDGAYSMLEQIAPPGYGTPAHVKRGEKEIRYVLAGEVTVETSEGQLVGTPGHTLVLKRGRPHRLRVTGDEPARMLVLFSPAGVEELYHEAGEEAPERQIPDEPTDGTERFEELAPEYGVEIRSEHGTVGP
jgi:quercetin dioxygenase-like cupin family protein